MLNVAAIDDHPVFLNGFANMMTTLPLVNTIKIYATHSDLLAGISQNTPDILFIDLKMPGIDGYELCSELRNRYSRIYIVVFTSYDYRVAEKAFKHGANAYMPKSADIELIESLLEDFAAGKAKDHAIHGIKEHNLLSDSDDPFIMIEKLTTREKEIMNMEAKGMKRSEITGALAISEHTYKSHITHIRAKLNLKSVSSLISFASRHFPIK